MSVDNISVRSKSPNPIMKSIDLSDLIKKRATIKGRLTLFIKFLSSFEGAQLTEKQLTEIQLRNDVAKSLNKEFNTVQSMIEETVSESEITQQLENRETFENLYFQAMTDVAILLKQRNCVIEPSSESKCNAHSSVRLPIISLPSFDGSYDSWLEYRDTYVSMIHNSEQLDNIQKFHYLRSSLISNAAQVIKSVEFTRENYAVAWELLTNRYDNCKLLIHNHVKAIFSMQSLHKESSFHIRKMIDNVLKNLRALKTLGEPTESWDTLIIYIITSKLDSTIEKEWENYRNNLDLQTNNRVISLNDLLTFLKNKADTLEMIRVNNNSSNNLNNKMQHEQYNKRNSQTVHSLATTSKAGAVTVSAPRRSTHNICKLCSANHLLYTCNKFINLSLGDRIKFVNNNNLCSNCLRSGHKVADCYFGSCKQCDQKHNTSLHGNEENLYLPRPIQDHTTTHVNSSTSLHSFDNSYVNNNNCDKYLLDTVLLSTALVEVAGEDNKYFKTRALLDSGSMHSIISYSLRNKLKVKAIQSTVQVTGIGQLITRSNESCEINLKSLTGDYNTRINCIVLDRITTSLSSVRVNRKSLNVPVNIGLADPGFHLSSEIDLLIGADCFWDLLVDGKIRLPTGPYLQNTTLGWIISGVVKNNKSHINRTRCNFIQTIQLNEQLKKFWELEEINKPNISSVESTICEKLFTETTKRVENGRFSVRIPLKKPVEILGDSYCIAEKRFLALERRLQKSPSYKDMYCEFMREYIRLGHMTQINNYNMPCYFIPHHGVLREHSLTTKLRVVFAANTETTTNVSLNDIQLTGPALQNDLFSILLRFRQYKYVACADIEKMYRQILIQEDQRNLQLIIWRENSTDPLSVYRLNVVTYGTTSAPYLSMRCIRQLAYECDDKNISRIILEDFYIDDFLSGSNYKSELSDICKKVSDVCSSGCFPLRKWIFNSPDITFNTHIKHENEANSKCLSLDENCSSRTLGLGWFNQSDEYHFVSQFKTDANTIITKRLILSVVSQIYDPLGLVSPIIMMGKVLLQKLWLCKIGWDDPVPKDIIIVWNKFVKSLSYLNTIRVPRYAMGNNNYSKLELHIFVDSSQAVYGASAYIRTCDSRDDVIAVRLLCSKTRVAPIKPVTIPRLELCGALLGARLLEKILKSLRLQFDNIIFWTDSTIVLGWLRTPPHLLKSFVQNRVVEISELTSNALWLHVNTKENPADIATRGASACELSSMDLWWHGPMFLRETGSRWKQNTGNLHSNTLPELKQSTIINTACINMSSDCIEFTKFSNLSRLQRSYAYVMRFLHNIRTKQIDNRHTGPLSVDELDKSLLFLIKQAQMQSFPDEYHALTNKLELKSSRILSSLNIFLDENNIIRVGGRLLNSDYTYDKKHPKLLCSKHHLTSLIFKYEHLKLLHAGPQLILSHIRENWWPLGGRTLARKIVRQCIICCRMRGKVIQPIMGNLPKERITASFPFMICGVDYAGPLFILNRRGRGAKLEKCYICLFVCFTTKALHLELVTSLSSDSYILALKRFISRRGKPSQIYSDNGKNFVGAAREFTKFLHDSRNSIVDYASENKIEFKFIPPYSPHFGGLWERGISSCKHHIHRVIKNANLTYEEFSTVLVQIEAVLNSRPMYPMSTDINDLNPITPSHFLIGRPLTSPAERDVTDTALPALSRFKRIEQLRQSFWKRWSTEYISELQRRTKWQSDQGDLKEGTLVLIKEDNLPPLKWRLGRVTKSLYPGSDKITRVADIRTATGIVRRAFSKICPLPSST